MAKLSDTDHLKSIEETKNVLLAHIQNIFNDITQDDFEPIWSILSEEVYTDILTDDFKSGLRSQLELDFNSMWHNSLLENSLNIIELLKQKFRNDPKPKWRPSNQPVSAQVLPFDIQMLNLKKKFLKNSIEREKVEIARLTEKLDERRKICKHINNSRAEVLKEVDEQIMIYEEHLERPNKFDAVALDML